MTTLVRVTLPGLASLAALFCSVYAFAQAEVDELSRPTPRLPDGTVNLGPAPGETGHWDGDTLVIDTVGFNEKFWFTRKPMGMVHTESLHLVERISRRDYDTLRYEVTVDDPAAYTRPWTASWEVPWTDYEIVEYLCTENNRDPAHFVGPQ